MTHRLISGDQVDVWLSCLGKAAAQCIPGPSFYPWYAVLHSGKSDKLEAFSFEDAGHSYFIPYLRKSVIADLSKNVSLFAIESPYGYAGIIASTEDRFFLERAWNEFVRQMQEKNVVAAFLRFDPLLQTHKYFAGKSENLLSTREVVIADLSAEELVLRAGFTGGVKNKINKARRAGVEVHASKSLEESMAFVPLYKATMDRLSARDFYRFGSAYFADLFQRKDVVCLIAKLNDVSIGGIVGFRYGPNAIVHLSATIDVARTNGTANLLRYELMLLMALQGCTKINFGGGSSDEESDSLLTYKKGFSKKTERYFLAKCPLDSKWHHELLSRWQFSKNFDEARTKLFIPYVN